MLKVRSFPVLVSLLALLGGAFSSCRDGSVILASTASPGNGESTIATSTMSSTIPDATETVTPVPATLTPNPLPTETTTAEVPAWVWYQEVEPAIDQGEIGGYALVTDYPAVLYQTGYDAAVSGARRRTLPGDEVYISYTRSETLNGVVVYEVEEGGWISSQFVQPVTPSRFGGIILIEMPASGFGWMVADAFSYGSADIEAGGRKTMHWHRRYSLFVVHEVAEDTVGARWFMIGDEEWVRDQDFAFVSSDMPENRNAADGRWIEVDLTQQTLTVFDEGRMIFATLVSTGRERGWTGPGTYTIYHTTEKHGLLSPDPATIGNYYLEDVPWILYYQGSWALHGAYWHDAFGRPNSHGCVNLSLADAHWLYTWAQPGDWVFLDW